MDDEKYEFCMPCENKMISKLATNWCSDCKLSVCEQCLENHNLMKKNHHVITAEQLTLVNSLRISFTEHCIDHSRDCNMYCPTHDYLICIMCAQRNHLDCTPAVPVDEVSQNSKMSTLKEHLEQEIEDVIRKLEDEIQRRFDNKQNIEKRKVDILNQIVNTRKLIDSKLDKLQEEITETLNAKYSHCVDEISRIEQQLVQHRQDFLKLKDNFNILIKFASNVQTFIGLRTLSKTSWAKNNSILHTAKGTKSFQLRLVLNEDFDTKCESITSFGDIIVDKTDTNLECIGGNIVQAPTISQTSVLKKKTTIRLPGYMWYSNNIQSCAILPNEKLVFLDKAFQQLVTMYTDGKVANTVILNGEPFDIAVITSRLGVKVAVTFPWSTPPRMDIMYIDDFRPIATTKFDAMCFGVTYNSRKEHLITIVKRTGVIIMDISGTILNTLPILGSGFFYLHYNEDKLYFSDEYNDRVVVYDIYGNEILKLNDIKSPRALSSDDSGNLYVSCSATNQVLRLQKKGKDKTKLLVDSDGLRKPTGIYFCNDNQLVLVCNQTNGRAFLYSVRKQMLGASESLVKVESDTSL